MTAWRSRSSAELTISPAPWEPIRRKPICWVLGRLLSLDRSSAKALLHQTGAPYKSYNGGSDCHMKHLRASHAIWGPSACPRTSSTLEWACRFSRIIMPRIVIEETCSMPSSSTGSTNPHGRQSASPEICQNWAEGYSGWPMPTHDPAPSISWLSRRTQQSSMCHPCSLLTCSCSIPVGDPRHRWTKILDSYLN